MASVATLKDLVVALIESAKEGNKLKEVTSNLESFFTIYFIQEEINTTLSSTAFETEERKNIISDVSRKAGYSSLTTNFLALAIELDKFKSLINNKEQIISRLKKASGLIKAEITAANSISDYDLKRVKDALNRVTGKQVEVAVNIDRTIIGGIIARVEDKVFDNSVKTQMERIRGALFPS